jgi:hypothetical protein
MTRSDLAHWLRAAFSDATDGPNPLKTRAIAAAIG